MNDECEESAKYRISRHVENGRDVVFDVFTENRENSGQSRENLTDGRKERMHCVVPNPVRRMFGKQMSTMIKFSWFLLRDTDSSAEKRNPKVLES